jgi:FtsZ-binding cell division protein ZapB
MSGARTSLTRMLSLAAVLSVGVAACGPSAELQRQLDELSTISAEKDSLLLHATENARLMSAISHEIVRMRSPAATTGAAEAPEQLTPDAIMAGIDDLTRRITESEESLARSQDRIETLTRDNSRLMVSARDFQRAAADFQATIANHRQTIATLTTEVDQLRDENQRLAWENTVLAEERHALVERSIGLSETIEHITDRENTVYYVAGRRADLLSSGLIEEQGGSRVLLVFGRRGKTVVPGRNLDPALFTAIDRRTVTEIDLPNPDREYRVASLQDLSALETPPDQDGDVRGALRIADPERFWANSRFLILVEQ